MLTIHDAVLKDLAAITDADVAKATKSLTASAAGEKQLGIVHNQEARRLYALGFRYKREGALLLVTAAYDLAGDERLDALRAASRCRELSDFTMDWFWLQAREDIGGSAWGITTNVGIRENWMLVSNRPDTDSFASALNQLRAQIEGQTEE